MAKRHNRSRETELEGGYLQPGHRDIPNQHPEMNAAALSGEISGSPVDVIGSPEGRRGGSLRGAPDITWFSLGSANSFTTITTTTLSAEKTVFLQGYNLLYTTGIYLSASSADMFITSPQEYNLFGTYTNRLSSENVPFTGISIPEWTITNNTNMQFTLPVPQSLGDIEIILVGPAGYTKGSSSIYTTSQSANKLITIVKPDPEVITGTVVGSSPEGAKIFATTKTDYANAKVGYDQAIFKTITDKDGKFILQHDSTVDSIVVATGGVDSNTGASLEGKYEFKAKASSSGGGDSNELHLNPVTTVVTEAEAAGVHRSKVLAKLGIPGTVDIFTSNPITTFAEVHTKLNTVLTLIGTDTAGKKAFIDAIVTDVKESSTVIAYEFLSSGSSGIKELANIVKRTGSVVTDIAATAVATVVNTYAALIDAADTETEASAIILLSQDDSTLHEQIRAAITTGEGADVLVDTYTSENILATRSKPGPALELEAVPVLAGPFPNWDKPLAPISPEDVKEDCYQVTLPTGDVVIFKGHPNYPHELHGPGFGINTPNGRLPGTKKYNNTTSTGYYIMTFRAAGRTYPNVLPLRPDDYWRSVGKRPMKDWRNKDGSLSSGILYPITQKQSEWVIYWNYLGAEGNPVHWKPIAEGTSLLALDGYFSPDEGNWTNAVDIQKCPVYVDTDYPTGRAARVKWEWF